MTLSDLIARVEAAKPTNPLRDYFDGFLIRGLKEIYVVSRLPIARSLQHQGEGS